MSVIIPVYNGLPLIREAIASVLAQTYQNVEILVIDDGSEDIDALGEVVRQCSPRVRLLRQSHAGVAAALNRGIAEMRGELFSWLSHDDVYHPEKLSLEVAKYLAAEEPSVIYSDYCYIDDGGHILGFVHIPEAPGGAAWPILIQHTWLHGCAMLIPKARIERAGGFDTRLQTTQDYDLFFRLARDTPFRHVAKVLAGVRLHARQTTQTIKPVVLKEQDDLYFECLSRARRIDLDRTPDPAKLFRHLYRRFTIGLLPRAALEARRLAGTTVRSTPDRLKLALSVIAVNAATAPPLRWLLVRRHRPRRETLTWNRYTLQAMTAPSAENGS